MIPADQDLRSRVAAHPFLAGMSDAHLQLLADCATAHHWGQDEVLFRAGDPAKGFFLIESGNVAVEGEKKEGQTVTIDVVAAGEPLGWSWIFEPFVCEYGARALEPTGAMFFDAVSLAMHRAADLTLGHELFKRMSQVMVRRLTAARAKLLEATNGDVARS